MRLPVLDKNFYPMIKALNDFDAEVKKNGNGVPVTLVAERSGGYNYRRRVTAQKRKIGGSRRIACVVGGGHFLSVFLFRIRHLLFPIRR